MKTMISKVWTGDCWNSVYPKTYASLVEYSPGKSVYDVVEPLKAKVEGNEIALAFNDYPSLIKALKEYEPKPAGYRVGQDLYVRVQDVPDLWISSISDNYVEYNYTTDAAFVEALNSVLGVQIGFVTVSPLEAKTNVDWKTLDDYIKKTGDTLWDAGLDFNSAKSSYIASISNKGLTVMTPMDTVLFNADGMQHWDRGQTQYQYLFPYRSGRLVVDTDIPDQVTVALSTPGLMDLTDNEKAAIHETLGMPDPLQSRFNDGVNDPIAESRLIISFYARGYDYENLITTNTWKTGQVVYGVASIAHPSATMYMELSKTYTNKLFADPTVQAISFDAIIDVAEKTIQWEHINPLPIGMSYTVSEETVNNKTYWVYHITMTRECCSMFGDWPTLRFTFRRDADNNLIGVGAPTCFYVDNLRCLTYSGKEKTVEEPWNASNTYLYAYTITKPGFYIASSVNDKADINIYDSSGAVADADVPKSSQLILFVPKNRGGQRCLCFYGSGLFNSGSEPFIWDWNKVYTIKSSTGFRLWSLT